MECGRVGLKPLLHVDGYNVIYADDELREIARRDLEQARIKLLEKLAVFALSSGEDVSVVFDASRNSSNKTITKSEVLGVGVCFSRSGQTADSALEKLAFEEVGKRTVSVVTSDYEEQKVLFAKGVFRRTPAELFAETREAEAEFTKAGKNKTRQSLEDSLDEEAKRVLRKLVTSDEQLVTFFQGVTVTDTITILLFTMLLFTMSKLF